MRKRKFSSSSTGSHYDPARASGTMKYAIALGSNMGDRLGWIEQACREMEAVGIRIYRTSGLFQTTAMYVRDQDDFLNGVCLVETTLEPLQLMRQLQAIEIKLGRVKVIDKGPRNIDLDILLWEHGEFRSDEPDLTIPHQLMNEREFVLEPLCQLIPAQSPSGELHDSLFSQPYVPSDSSRSYQQSLDALRGPGASQISTRTQLHHSLPTVNTSSKSKRTHIMSILNLTPDSFSDGGNHSVSNEEYLRTIILGHLNGGATILDLGGQSSRPGAPDVSAEEEIARLTPALKVLSSLRKDANTPPFAISIDTYRAAVAEAAVREGADIINDISAGLLDPDMLPTVARLGCTYIMMHMRGTPHTMTSKENTTYDGDLIETIKNELGDRVAAAEAAGIRRWRMILDPGIGFAKTASQNLEILRRLRELTLEGRASDRNASTSRNLEGIPWLVGASRKGFIGKITGVKEAAQRGWGTAATVTAAVAGGADIVRVHDVAEMTQVARMSEAIYRNTCEARS